jgi:hypothetical protein
MVKHDGEKAVNVHEQSKKHRQLSSAQSTSQLVTSFFFLQRKTQEKANISIAELAFVYHAVKHQHSFNSGY